MAVNITIRNVPDEVRDTLSARAAREHKSMQEYLREQLVKMADKPTIEEWLERVRARKRLFTNEVTAEEIVALIREDRDR